MLGKKIMKIVEDEDDSIDIEDLLKSIDGTLSEVTEVIAGVINSPKKNAGAFIAVAFCVGALQGKFEHLMNLYLKSKDEEKDDEDEKTPAVGFRTDGE